ncbi:MAG: DUF3311 domain-containing protein [Steroidobacteraceae bacterium]
MKSRLRKTAWLYLLFLIPYVAMLWVPSYNRVEPTLFGFPFFYWYQLAWVPISAVIIAIVYFVRGDE